MTPIEFPEQTLVIAKNQPEYLPMPAHIFNDSPYGQIAFCWKMTLKERLQVLFTGCIWQQMLTFGMPPQPQRLSIGKPDMPNRTAK